VCVYIYTYIYIYIYTYYIICFTKVHVLTLYWYKSTNTEGNWMHLRRHDA
jgi:hypothetical protein